QLFVVSRMNGANSLRDIQAHYCRATGQIVPMEQFDRLVSQLNDLHYLDGEGFRAYLAGLEETFRSLAVRPSRHAGSAYEAEADRLRRQIADFFTHPEGPGTPAGPGSAPVLRGLVAPHIDFHRGGITYAHAYKTLAEQSEADTFIIFGTCHGPMPGRFALTEKGFDTALGVVPADREFVQCLTSRLGRDTFLGEFAHRGEHSIELQTVFLAYLLGGCRDFRIVPILVGSFQDICAQGSSPACNPEVAEMVRAVRETMAEIPRSYCLLAAADLAHVGRRFGDASGPTEATMREVERRDRGFLTLVEAGDAEGVFRSIAEDGDRRRVCGYPSIYMTLSCLERPVGRLLQYRQWADFPAGAAVTFAGVAIY
ncbi:MAG: AmmeMemoRadiSam system protein B, partial [Acidobacteriota bacterium]